MTKSLGILRRITILFGLSKWSTNHITRKATLATGEHLPSWTELSHGKTLMAATDPQNGAQIIRIHGLGASKSGSSKASC